MKSFEGQCAVVTGGGTGIGRAIAEGLSAEGATVAVVGRRADKLKEASNQGVGASRITPYPADLADDSAIDRLAAGLERDFGQVDLLVHSAGAHALAPVADTSAEEFDRQLRVNLRAPFALTRALLPLLRRRGGDIVFINSSAGLSAREGAGAYAASKHGLRALADSLRQEVNADGIRVLSVFLGRTATPLQEEVHRAEGRAYDPSRLVQPSDVAAMVIQALRLPRTAEVTDLSIRPAKRLP